MRASLATKTELRRELVLWRKAFVRENERSPFKEDIARDERIVYVLNEYKRMLRSSE